MLLSMTGFGSATAQNERLRVAVEIKTVNGRFLKVSIKAPSALMPFESQLEKRVQKRLRRGSVMVAVDLEPVDPGDLVAINEEVVRAYQATFRRLALPEDRIPMLPGVLGARQEALSESEWQLVAQATDGALDKVVTMRATEGGALAEAVMALVNHLGALTEKVAARAPAVANEQQGKLKARIERLLASQGNDLPVALEPDHLAREVALFADRSDVTEELDRLGAHLQQTRELIEKGGEVGRSLEFMAQELHREVNTIGSKSADHQIALLVVAMKAELEKIKEQLANVE